MSETLEQRIRRIATSDAMATVYAGDVVELLDELTNLGGSELFILRAIAFKARHYQRKRRYETRMELYALLDDYYGAKVAKRPAQTEYRLE